MTRHDYLPFGEELFANQGLRSGTIGYSASDSVREKFTQKERDTETGLDYFGARYYGSMMGRFTSADSLVGSLSNPQTLNRYAYVGNDPLNFTDPTGHFRLDVPSKFENGGELGSNPYEDAIAWQNVEYTIAAADAAAANASSKAGEAVDGTSGKAGSDESGSSTAQDSGRSEEFTNCAKGAGLSWMWGGTNPATGFNDAGAIFINHVADAENANAGLLGFSFWAETNFNQQAYPNMKAGAKRKADWDYGPFHMNWAYTSAELAAGNYSSKGIDLVKVFGGSPATGDVSSGPFSGVPFENGRLAARKLNWLMAGAKGNMRTAAARYSAFKGDKFVARRSAWDSHGKQFINFFTCFASR